MPVVGVKPFAALFVHCMGVRISVYGPVQLHSFLDPIGQVDKLLAPDTISDKVAYCHFIIIKGKINMG